MTSLQQQYISEMQRVQSAQLQARMMQQTKMQQMQRQQWQMEAQQWQIQGQQWAQHSLPQQQTQPNKYPSYQTTNTGQLVVVDQYGYQWTPEQYREMLRRQQQQQQQMAQLSAMVRPILHQQGQNIPRESPPMTVSQRPSNNRGHPLAPWPRAELLQHQQMYIRSPQAFTRPCSQWQPQPALPVMTSYPQQPVHPTPSGGQLAQKQLAEIARVRQAQKSVLPTSKSSNGAKVPIPAKPSTQPAAHKQGVKKTQKQPRTLPVLIPAPAKIPAATHTVQQASVAQVKPVAHPVTPKPCNPTMALPIRTLDMLPPPVPSSPRDPLSARASTSASPSAAPSQHSPCLPAATSINSDTIDMTDAEFEKAIQEELSKYFADCQRYASEKASSQGSVPGESGSCLSSPQPTTTTNTPQTTTTTNTPQTTTTTASTPQATPTTATTTPQPAPTPDTPLPTTTTTSTPPLLTTTTTTTLSSRSPSPSFSLFATYQDLDSFTSFSDYADGPQATMPASQDGDPSRAPEERGLSEERVRLEWEIMALGEKYVGGDDEMEGGEVMVE